MLSFFYALVYPHITYAIIIWDGAARFNIMKLKTIVNQILRNILRVKTIDFHPTIPTLSMYNLFKIIPFDYVYKYPVLNFMRAAVKNKDEIYDLYYKPLLSDTVYPTRNSLFNLPSICLEVEKRQVIFRA